MPSENRRAGFGGYKLPGLDPGSVVKANLRRLKSSAISSQLSVKALKSWGLLLGAGDLKLMTVLDVLSRYYGQATKGVRWMPWR